MLTMAVGHSDDPEPADAIAAVIAECRATLDGRAPQAGLLFSAFDSFDPSIVAAVRDAFPGVRVVGATSGGELSSMGGYQEDSITLALFASDDVEIRVGMGQGLATDAGAAARAAVEEALTGLTKEPRVCIVLADAFSTDPSLLLEAVREALPAGVEVLGGASATGNLARNCPTYQFRDDAVVDDGIAVLLFAGPLAYSVAVGTGWTSIGTFGVVTAAKPGLICEIDGRPALEFVSRYLDSTGPASYGNPIAIFEDGADEPYLRVAMGSDPTLGTVGIAGSVPVGARVRLSTANTDDILGGVSEALSRAGAGFPAGARPEAALVFSCVVRKFLLGTRTGTESDLVRDALGPSIPFAGLYCTGEIGPAGPAGESRFLNETFVTLLLGS